MLLRRLAIAIGLLCALLGSQLPEFAQQYRQRLGGALDELDRMITQFDVESSGQSLTRDQGLDRLNTNDDPLARERGAAIAADIGRAERLQRQQDALRSAGPLTRLAAMTENFDAPTVRRALGEYEPAVPVTIEALVIGAIGLAVGWGATHLLAWPVRRRRARLARARAA
jgi:Protein of unknown function (DUF2937)